MVAPLPEAVAVVSCHVERPLADDVWERFRTLQERRPSGFPVAALMRPPHRDSGEDEERWAERAREAAARGPLGHHPHWTAPDHARPTTAGAGARVLAEGRRLRELELAPTLFCGGGWYTDVEVAEACVELGYVDCTPRGRPPAYLPADAPWAALDQPARVELPSGRALLAHPTTHSLGELARGILSRRLPRVVHVDFHDTDLLDARRAAFVRALLTPLARRREVSDLERLARSLGDTDVIVSWDDVARPAA